MSGAIASVTGATPCSDEHRTETVPSMEDLIIEGHITAQETLCLLSAQAFHRTIEQVMLFGRCRFEARTRNEPYDQGERKAVHGAKVVTCLDVSNYYSTFALYPCSPEAKKTT